MRKHDAAESYFGGRSLVNGLVGPWRAGGGKGYDRPSREEEA